MTVISLEHLLQAHSPLLILHTTCYILLYEITVPFGWALKTTN